MDTFVYQYIVGGAIFAAGIYFAARQGYLSASGRGLRRFLILGGGLLFFMGLQGYMQYGAMSEAATVDYTGSGLVEGTRGTPVDYAIMGGYFLLILMIGTWFGRGQKSTKDFFFGGQRFSWWLIAMSLIATTVGSYSFVKYSKVAYQYGLSSSQTYLNDWFWIPLFIFGWLPIVYFSRIISIPEYFERRFTAGVRAWATALLLLYLIGYVGVNLFTMGKALNHLLGWPIFWSAVLVAAISATYVTAGGQTSVIMTDLFQGVMLLATGGVLLLLGAQALGGLDGLWAHLPRGHRTAFPNFNTDPSFNGVGIFWQDAVANSAVFYFLNQGVMMRFMAARSVDEGRKAALFVPLVLMPIAACVVASGGWVGRALEHAGLLPPDMDGGAVFFIAADFLCTTPGLFGLVMAALTAALMSTVDTLITAVAAIVVNDVYRRHLSPNANETELLRVARICSVGVALLGISLVPVFMSFGSIYEAHGAFTAAVTPPLVITLLLSVFWRRFTATAAIWTLAGGMVAIGASIVFPELITPIAHGIPLKEVEPGLLAGKNQYKYIRALYGLVTCGAIGVIVTLLTRPESSERMQGLVWGTVKAAIRQYKGSDGEERPSTVGRARIIRAESAGVHPQTQLSMVRISPSLAELLSADAGDLLHLSDARWWLGGLRSVHVLVAAIDSDISDAAVISGPGVWAEVATDVRADRPIRVERLY